MREGAGSRPTCVLGEGGYGLAESPLGVSAPCSPDRCCRVGIQQVPSPCRSLGASLLWKPPPAKLPVPARVFAGLRQKCAEPPVDLGHCCVVYLRTASSLARRGDPGWVDDALSETVLPADPLDNSPMELPGSSCGKTHSSAEGFARDVTLRSQPSFSRVHNSDSWVTVRGQGDGKQQGQRAGEGRGDERRWAAGSGPSGAEPLSSCIVFSQGALRSPSVSHRTLGFRDSPLAKPLCKQ